MLAMHTPSSAAPSRLLGTPASELKFRVQGGEHHGRMLRISAAKCSIGSARGCTLRLNASFTTARVEIVELEKRTAQFEYSLKTSL